MLSSNILNLNNTQQAWHRLNLILINYPLILFKGGKVANIVDIIVINLISYNLILTVI